MTGSKLEKISLGGLGISGALTATGIFAENKYLFAIGCSLYAGFTTFFVANLYVENRKLHRHNSTQSNP